MSYDRYVEPRRRLAILCVLSFERNSQLPIRLLRDKLALLGYAEAVDRIRTDCAWLAEQGLLEVERTVVALSERGAEVVAGLAVTPGVTQPSRGEAEEMRRLLVNAGIAAAQAELDGG